MSNPEKKSLILAGDVGGTKTVMGLFSMGKTRPISKAIEVYSSKEAPNLEDIIDGFLRKHSASIASACFGIAGPVVNGRCKTTNLPWEISEDSLKRHFKWPNVCLINDLTATSLAIPLLSSREVISLNKAKVRKKQNVALIAPGTGLGQALLVFSNGKYVPMSSEGGHADFSPNSEAEVRLWQYLHKRLGHVSIERVLSGPGLLNIYSWLRDSRRYSEPPWLTRKIKETDPARAITESAINENDPLCMESVNMFVSIFGAAAGNLALTGMATGGVFLGGGISPKILTKLKEGLFIKAFADKGRFKYLLERIPVRVILNDKAAILGAAKCAFDIHGR